MDSSPFIRYRRINGLTFVKNEYLLDFPTGRDPKRLPSVVLRHAHRDLGVEPTGDARADLRAMTLAAVRRDICDGTSNALEELIAAVVLSAVTETGSDYGMSSGVRDLYSVEGAEPAGIDGVLALKKADFFCCCLPHPEQMSDMGDETVPIVWRAAQRMMYNRWHFVPGEFPRERIPERRHYFFPPQVPDIAEHADHRHGGHIASRVKYTIRAPGAQMWHAPFRLFGNDFRGCYDIRLVRMEGPPFTLRELREAVRHCSLVDEFWRTLATLAQRERDAVPAIRGFDRAWYEARAWDRVSPYADFSSFHAHDERRAGRADGRDPHHV